MASLDISFQAATALEVRVLARLTPRSIRPDYSRQAIRRLTAEALPNIGLSLFQHAAGRSSVCSAGCSSFKVFTCCWDRRRRSSNHRDTCHGRPLSRNPAYACDKNAQRPDGNPNRGLTLVGIRSARAEVEIQSSAFRMKRTPIECV